MSIYLNSSIQIVSYKYSYLFIVFDRTDCDRMKDMKQIIIRNNSCFSFNSKALPLNQKMLLIFNTNSAVIHIVGHFKQAWHFTTELEVYGMLMPQRFS